MHRQILLVVLLLVFAGLFVGLERTREPVARGAASPSTAGNLGLLAPGPLAQAAGRLGAGPRLIAGVRVGRAARVDMAGTQGTGRSALVIGCLDASRCAWTELLTWGLYGCPPADHELWTVSGLRGGVRREGWRALRRLVSDLRPRLAVLYTRGTRPGVRATGPGAWRARRYARRTGVPFTPHLVGGGPAWVGRVLPESTVVEVALPIAPTGRPRLAHFGALRQILGLDAAPGRA